eukprot:TRINITY_DN28142_c0_g1_i1.p1 TRINITY_DN28142_c0_g1~~TRINITY_DN28142_c0_g1_i1.p1  ORF type:complete len:219 (+),score=34.64 TRINITY_DN28142_c0_g1_i1:21-677(+)
MGAAFCSKRRTPQQSPWPWVYALRAEAKSFRGDPSVVLPVELLPHLLLGDQLSARDIGSLKRLGVTHVLNLAGRPASNKDVNFAGCGIEHETISADDEEGYPMLARHWEQARQFISRARSGGGRCLVHCVAGLNRSGVIAAAEVLLHEELPVLAAVKKCRQARGSAAYLSNKSFQVELVAFAAERGLLGPQPPGFSAEPPPTLPPPPKARDALAGLVG